ncbi:MAG: tRNA (N6-threonylcarbamoyladenosine(37)-N6)-methyltransferase TrmO [Candidatus Krumholzibacteriota bacterium]|nr:tRNA (N6-threonylcarbamoyladenosine(37)-N6)-methyltransferase TrmO [Candidatus Krumholzibacteriota bacterium]
MTETENIYGRVEFRPIGIVHSPFLEVAGMPIQPSRSEGAKGTVEIFDEFVEGLCDLDGFSHIILLYHLHLSRGYSLKVIPFLDDQPRGLFATRAPRRPNPIGLSVVRLAGVEKNILSVEDLDILDGTPLLDIKPFVGEFDSRKVPRIGWLESVRKKKTRSDERFK